jgi:ribosome-binding protein aMBF1 (putative translation factor)
MIECNICSQEFNPEVTKTRNVCLDCSRFETEKNNSIKESTINVDDNESEAALTHINGGEANGTSNSE